jgi:hypothetical protein
MFIRTSVALSFQNEDIEERGNSENIELEIAHNKEKSRNISNGILPFKSPTNISDDELSSDVTPADAAQNFNLHSSPATDCFPQPLFTDVELAGSNQNTAFFIEDSDDIDLYVRRGGFTKRTLPCSQELKVLSYPLFYCGLIVTSITEMSILSFWTLLPLLLKSRLQDFQFYQAIVLLSVAGTGNFCSAVGSYWLPAASARLRKLIFIISSYIAAGGLYSKFFRHHIYIKIHTQQKLK